MRNVLINMVTKKAELPTGEVDGPFTYRLHNVEHEDDSADLTAKDGGTSYTFQGVPTGSYVVTVSKLGFEAETTFMLEPDQNAMVDVPDTVSVTLSGDATVSRRAR